ncbi:MAG TPA: hypothetical protein VHI72_16830 [Hyphomicrobiaceae bacterium]|nr:hypothetical protein [Hyphomicrobiaceae bacterium]
MRIPEVRVELRQMAARLREQRERLDDEIHRLEELINQLTCRRLASPGSRRAVFPRATPELRAEIHEYARAHPDLAQSEIALHFGINPGRLSECLHGWRQ